MSKLISDHRWYYRLVGEKGLLSSMKKFTETTLIVSWDTDARLFSYFPSLIEFINYINKIPVEKWTFFEVILNKFQKPHFDIDAKLDEKTSVSDIEDTISELITCSLDFLNNECNIECSPSDILIYTSHGSEKRSYHIIFNGFYHLNSVDAKYFYEIVTSRMKSQIKHIIDKAVYSTIQQFRMIQSHKKNSNRTKIQSSFNYKNQLISVPPTSFDTFTDIIDYYSSSLISFVCNAKQIVLSVPKKTYKITSDIELTDENINFALESLKDYLEIDVLPFKIKEIRNNLIVLIRTRSSHCPSCDRDHDSENPFLVVANNKILYHCRRANNPTEISSFENIVQPKTISFEINKSNKFVKLEQKKRITRENRKIDFNSIPNFF